MRDGSRRHAEYPISLPTIGFVNATQGKKRKTSFKEMNIRMKKKSKYWKKKEGDFQKRCQSLVLSTLLLFGFSISFQNLVAFD